MRKNPISATIDLSADGVQHGHLRLPHSRDDSAWGSIMIPITVAKNGDGPTALITGANHGDEYEGPLALVELAQTIQNRDLTGRVIIVPFMNYPAFISGTRTSSADRGNMNRSFPGNPDGTIAEKIADYFQRTLLPMADYVLDFHSGGKTLNFLPIAASHILDNKSQEARCQAARDAFNAPWSLEMVEIDSSGMYDGAAESMGKVFVTTELGGGGSSSVETVAIARKGIRNFLIHADILSGVLEMALSTHLAQPGNDCFVFSHEEGMIEFTVSLGDTVRQGDTIARIWNTRHTGKPANFVHSKMGGLMIARHYPGLIQIGDCLAVLAVEA